jgi:hypothetical protein
MNIPKIISVTPLENSILLVKFENDVEKVYDCTKLLSFEAFHLLNNVAFFNKVTLDVGGYGISWNAEVDLSEYELWTNGVELFRQPK